MPERDARPPEDNFLGSWSAELRPQGVGVNVVAPGIVETPLTSQIKDHPEWYRAYADKSILGRWAKPHELVGAVIYLASEASSYVTGPLCWSMVGGRPPTVASLLRCESFDRVSIRPNTLRASYRAC